MFVEMLSFFPNIKNQKIHFVGKRRIKFDISEFSDLSVLRVNVAENADKVDHRIKEKSDAGFKPMDAILLCFSISSVSSLLSAVTYWVPTLATTCPSTPIVMVGCKSDMRHSAGSQPHRTVSHQQAMATAEQCGAVMYVETSAKTSERSTAAAFEVAA